MLVVRIISSTFFHLILSSFSCATSFSSQSSFLLHYKTVWYTLYCTTQHHPKRWRISHGFPTRKFWRTGDACVYYWLWIHKSRGVFLNLFLVHGTFLEMRKVYFYHRIKICDKVYTYVHIICVFTKMFYERKIISSDLKLDLWTIANWVVYEAELSWTLCTISM